MQAARTQIRWRQRGWIALWGLASLTVVVLVLGVIFLKHRDNGSTPTRPAMAAAKDVGCSSMEQVAYHVHVHLAIFVDGQPVAVPANIGIHPDCITWLHTHDSSGVLHIEAPEPRTYTLGAFFQVWGQPLDATHLLDHVADAQHQVRAFVNGQLYSGAPETIPLDPHAVIVLEFSPPFVTPPEFTFPPGL